MKSNSLLSLLKASQVLLLLTVMAIPSASWAALYAYMSITGDTQGEIKGSVTMAGREDSMEVINFGYNVSTPYDPASGAPTGQRQHRPIRILKEIDKASPLLFQALVTNENLSEVIIRFYQPSQTGQQVQFYTVWLYNARLVSIVPSSEAGTQSGPLEALSFVFQHIEIIYEDGGITGADDWASPIW
ncbi:MAG: type VI secretion system tube protein Hcp [Gammaproteobacteria bacterium]|nr:type VI secretion system tube protein Hcp [Gammaproteobacteria bacterium]